MSQSTARGTATFVRSLDGWRGDARLFRVDPPVQYGWQEPYPKADHVVVSAVVVLDTPETYLFPASADTQDDPLSWSEMDGSYRGGLDHAEALRRAGYDIAAVTP